MTPIQELIETIEKALQITMDDQTKRIFLEKEKKSIIEAYKNGAYNDRDRYKGCGISREVSAEQYYNNLK